MILCEETAPHRTSKRATKEKFSRSIQEKRKRKERKRKDREKTKREREREREKEAKEKSDERKKERKRSFIGFAVTISQLLRSQEKSCEHSAAQHAVKK